MTCKKCNQELPEVGTFCPYCGASQEESAQQEVTSEEVISQEAADEILAGEALGAETPAEETAAEEPVKKRKIKTWQLILAIVCGVVLLAVVVGAVLYGMGIDLRPRENDIHYKDAYTVDDETLVDKSRNVVATMGDKELTVGELQMHYQSAFYTFYSQNYYYMSYMGLDLTQPLSEQTMLGDETMTWEQYFVESALQNWQSYALLEIVAEKEGFEVSPELKEVLDNLDATALEMAVAYGYETVEEWLENDVGVGVTLADYARYNTAYYVGSDYLNAFYEANEPTQEEIDAYYAENEATFTENGITKDLGLNSSVRHILISPETNGTDEEGKAISTEDDWAAAYAEAERILQEWQAGAATEESFAELANTYSADGGSNTTGGLYENINVDESYMESFENWAIDPARVSGETGIVETDYGYHIMYFVSGEEYCDMLVAEQVVADRIKAMLEENIAAYPLEVNYRKILVGELDLA